MTDDGFKRTLLARVYDVASETPLYETVKLSQQTGNRIYLKREDMQPIHSFKIRGAYNKIISLPENVRSRGVIAASAGNHAQGVALSASKLHIAATIVMPRTTPQIKIEAVKGYGAEVILAGDNYSEAYEHCLGLIKASGKTFIHPFDDPHVIAGQGTIGREILMQLPTVDYIFVPIGGGGLVAGTAQYVKSLRPDVHIIGVEPDDSNAMQLSLAAGKRIVLPHVGVFADGVAVKQVGKLTFELCRRYVDEVVTVNNDQICAAIKHVFEATRSIVEPAGALSVAGALQYAEQHKLQNKQLVTICSGANVAFDRLQFIAERTLLGSGKEALFDVRMAEQAGALSTFCREIINGHNISEFSYRLASRSGAHILVGINVAGNSDKQAFIAKMKRSKYKYTDLSADNIVKEHIRHMIGSPGHEIRDERVYEIVFPERPKALTEFLASLGNTYNISLFHYRGQGGDVGKVLIGFEAENATELESALRHTGYEFHTVTSPALAFLQY